MSGGYLVERWVCRRLAENGSVFCFFWGGPLRLWDRPLLFWKSGVTFLIFAFSLQNGWICTKVYWSKGKTEDMVWILVAILVCPWFCYRLVVKSPEPHIHTKTFVSPQASLCVFLNEVYLGPIPILHLLKVHCLWHNSTTEMRNYFGAKECCSFIFSFSFIVRNLPNKAYLPLLY